MFNLIGSLTKAVVGAVIETPIAVAADIVTFGGSITDKDKPYTAEAVEKVIKNIGDATKPSDK